MKPFKLLIAIILLALLIFIGQKFVNKIDKENIIEQVQSTKQVDDELQKIMDEENFKKSTLLRARKIANDKKKAIEIERNKKALESIEAEYESIRAEELLLVGTDSSLK